LDYNKADIKMISEQIRWAKSENFNTCLLLGAGISKSAGIPLAYEIINIIKEKFPGTAKRATKETYPEYMRLLTPLQRRELIGSFIDKAQINVAHLYLGSLVKEGYVNRIFTVNFDPLIIRSLNLFNLYPAVYDFAASQKYIPGAAAHLSVFYLHGQRDGFVLLNTEEEVKSHTHKLKNIFQDFRNCCWIVVGYSGKNDPVFEGLADIDIFHNKLFWIGYQEDPGEHILKGILNPKSKYGYFLKGLDADTFFLNLAKELNLEDPQIISRPFTHLKEAISSIKEFTIDEKLVDLTKETKEWVNATIRLFEKDEDFYKIKVFQKIKEDHLVRKVRDIYVHNKFDQVADIYMDVVSSDIEEAKYYLCYTLNNWGLSLIEQAKTEIKEAARQRILHAIEKFEYAIDVMPDQYKLFNNLGMAQSELALIKSGKNAEKLYEQAIENFQTAIKYNPDCYNAYDNWGMALLYLAKMKSDEQAERIYSNALEIFKKVEEIKPNFAAYNLACLYSIQGKKDEALKWLEKGLKSKSTPSKEYILKDCDLENIKNTKEFKDLLK